jgi:hypothetical protein
MNDNLQVAILYLFLALFVACVIMWADGKERHAAPWCASSEGRICPHG